MSNTSEAELSMLRAAELYYYESLTHAQIAEQLGTSRWTVGRLLDRAREVGIVRINIEHPLARHHHLELQLRERFGVRDAIVVPSQSDSEATADAVSHAAAELLASLRPRPASVGVSWGRTTSRVAAQLANGWNRGVTVVQTNGGLSVAGTDHVGQALRTMAERGPGQVRLMPAPTIVSSAGLGRALRAEPSVAGAIQAAEQSRVIVFSPGSATATSVLVDSGYLTLAEVQGLTGRGVVGDLLSHFVDANGDIVDAELDERTISMDLGALRTCPHSIAVVTGAEKVAVTRAMLTGGYCRTLVTDAEVATAVLATTGPETSNHQ
ncbi:sugar-binding transcriptional regulator [Propionibacteriaceae bacterium Y1923]|uniref:sugar-binding transcriptional regulator n=1 Tax=Aestuariimicrobium sp. Y1814 TaxID=3418742 RepID=UPI003C1C47A2